MNGKPLLKEKDKKRKERKKTTKQLKKELDTVFSQFIRLKYSNEQGEVKCYTCPMRRTWKEMQNGHFVSRSYLATRYSEENCRPQCVGCNIFGRGKTALFGTSLQAELGEGIITRLYRKAQEIVKDYPYAEKIEYYKQKIKELEKLPVIK